MNGPFDWSAVAPAWEKHAEQAARNKAAATDELLAGIAIAPGDRVLELGAGAGDLAQRLSDSAGPDGTVVISDAYGGMVDILRRKALGLPNVTVEQIDATDIGLEAASFDAVVFCMGLMFTLDPAGAMTEIRRVLAPAGRAGIEVWAGPEHNPWVTSIGMAAMLNGVVAGGPPTQPGAVFSLGDEALLRTAISSAGFEHVAITPVDVEFRFADFDDYFENVSSLAGPLAVALASASPDQVQAVRQTAAELTSKYAVPDGMVLPGRALVAIAS